MNPPMVALPPPCGLCATGTLHSTDRPVSSIVTLSPGKYGWSQVREDFGRPVGERYVNARRVFFGQGNGPYIPDAAFLRAYWDAGNACTSPLKLTYRGVSVDLPEILPRGGPV